MYIAGRDRCFRPIVVLKSAVVQSISPIPSGEDIIAATLLIFEYIKHFMESPGRVENINLIMDPIGVNLLAIPYNLITQQVDAVIKNYKCVARAIYIVNAPYVFAMAWNSISYLLDENTSRKIQISSGNINDNILE